jgi:hypothetical protein
MNEKWVTKSVVVVVYGREEMKTVVLREEGGDQSLAV